MQSTKQGSKVRGWLVRRWQRLSKSYLSRYRGSLHKEVEPGQMYPIWQARYGGVSGMVLMTRRGRVDIGLSLDWCNGIVILDLAGRPFPVSRHTLLRMAAWYFFERYA